MIRFRLLGALDVRDADGNELRAALSQPKRLALLAYLISARPAGFHRRDTLLALFWPELDSGRARDALNQSLRYLREILGSETIVSRGAGDVGVDTTRLWCDVTAFRELCASGRHRDAIDLYQGEFLTGIFVSDSATELDQWVEQERRDLRNRASSAALVLAERAAESGDSKTACELARRSMVLEHESEAALRTAIRILDRVGDRAAALALHDDFARRLANDLDAEPTPETRRLVDGIRSRQVAYVTASDVEDTMVPAVAVAAQPAASTSSWLARRRVWIAPIVAITMLTATAAAIVSTRDFADDPLRNNVVVVAPMTVLGPELELWREGLVDVLSRSLDGAGELRTIAPSAVLKAAGGQREIAPEKLARLTGARFVLIGMLQRRGHDSARLSLVVRDVASQSTRGEIERRDAISRIDILADSVAVDVMRLLLGGRSRPSEVRTVGTRSLPALKEFLQGQAYYRRRDWDSSETHFARAIALDSAFALAYAGVANASGQRTALTAVPEAATYAFRAAAFNHGLGKRDSAVIALDSIYMAAYSNAQALPRDPDHWAHVQRAMAMSKRLVADDPQDAELWVRYAEVRYHFGGVATRTREREVLDAFDRAIALDSSLGPAYSHVGTLGLLVGGWNHQKRYGESAARYGVGSAATDVRVVAELERAATSRSDRARRIVDSLPIEELWSNFQAVEATDVDGTLFPAATARLRAGIKAGKLAASEIELNERAVRLLLKFGRYAAAAQMIDAETQPVTFMTAALLGAIPGERAAPVFGEWLGATTSPIECLRLVDWWAQRGDVASIERCAARRVRELGADSVTTVRRMVTPARALGEAYTALARRDTARAVRVLDAFPDSLCAVWCWFTLEPRVRLLAAVGRDRDAFELAQHRSYVDFAFSAMTAPMALTRARLAARLADRTATAEYRVVAELWANADSSLRLAAAEAEAAIR